MSVWLDGRDVTALFLPWGGRGGRRRPRPEEAVAVVAPRPGANRLSVRLREPDGSQHETTVDFEFVPREMPVRLRVVEGGADVPARLSFRGLDGTPDPRLAPEIWDEIVGPDAGAEELRTFLYTEGQPVSLHLPRGRYEVIASRGPAYSLARATIAPDAADVTLDVERVMQTAGWVSADFHVHAIPSSDSALPLRDRVASYVAQDVDVIVASDHFTITDYRQDLGPDYPWPGSFSAIPGDEAGVARTVHWNFWPLERDMSNTTPTPAGGRSYGGRQPASVRDVSSFYDYFEKLNRGARHARFGDFPVVVQLNHPRGIRIREGRDTPIYDYLNRVGYDPREPLGSVRNGALLARPRPDLPRPIDFDALELLNRRAYRLYLQVRDDWFSFISQGFVPTGTANSDSHWLVVTEAGFPRNWVRYDGPLPVRAEDLARAVRARNVVGSNGPLVTVEPWSADGSPLRGPVDHIDVTVRAPAWIPIEEVRVYLNGQLVARRPLPAAPEDPWTTIEQVHRLEIPVDVADDAYIVVEAGDGIDRLLSSEPEPGPLGRIFPDVRVLAFTNPLLIDARGDGSPWD